KSSSLPNLIFTPGSSVAACCNKLLTSVVEGGPWLSPATISANHVLYGQSCGGISSVPYRGEYEVSSREPSGPSHQNNGGTRIGVLPLLQPIWKKSTPACFSNVGITHVCSGTSVIFAARGSGSPFSRVSLAEKVRPRTRSSKSSDSVCVL